MSKIELNCTKSTTDSVVLEETLLSFGALAAVATVRRSFPNAGNFVRRFDQHHDHDMDIPEKYRKMIS